jgi:hypothetical protein
MVADADAPPADARAANGVVARGEAAGMMMGAGALAEGGSRDRLTELEGGEEPGVTPELTPASTTRVLAVRSPAAVPIFRGLVVGSGLQSCIRI